MKIRAEVIEVGTVGEHLIVTLIGKGRKDAYWRSLARYTIQLPDTKPNRKAFYIGRVVKMDVTP
jgi:hypothetical protein